MKFTFWKDNKVSQEYTLTLDEIKAKYEQYLATKEKDWIEYYGSHTIRAFVGEKEGLNSVTDADYYDVFEKELEPVWCAHLEGRV